MIKARRIIRIQTEATPVLNRCVTHFNSIVSFIHSIYKRTFLVGENMKKAISIFCFVVLCSTSYGQANADELFKAARTAAFEEKNEAKAIQLARQALSLTPHYADVEIFLGRVYSWTKQYDSAVIHFENVLSYSPNNEEAIIAYSDIEYWNHHYDKALAVTTKGLTSHPASEELLLRKAKILIAQKQYKEASLVTDQLLKINNKNAAAIALASSIRDAVALNKIGAYYDYLYFDREGMKPWHLAGVSYSRQTKAGPVSLNLNYAKRFGITGWQGEVDMYPRISKSIYSYVSFGYSPNAVTPK